jgi:hypothetical protein
MIGTFVSRLAWGVDDGYHETTFLGREGQTRAYRLGNWLGFSARSVRDRVVRA